MTGTTPDGRTFQKRVENNLPILLEANIPLNPKGQSLEIIKIIAKRPRNE